MPSRGPARLAAGADSRRCATRLALLALGVAALAGQCILVPEDDTSGIRGPNLRPVARIVTGLVADSTATTACARFRWFGADRDGSISAFEWAVDDTIGERAWTRTRRLYASLCFRASEPAAGRECAGWHVFYVRAIDNEGARSVPDRRYFSAHTIAPSSRIVTPPPLAGSRLASTLRITWDGEDLDCSNANLRPAWFEYKLVRFGVPISPTPEARVRQAFAESTNVFLRDLDPADFPADSLGDYFAQARRAWLRAPGALPGEVLATGLDIGVTYGFAVRAIDEAGAVEPEFAAARNWMFFVVENARIRVEICEPKSGCQAYNNSGFEQVWHVTAAPGQAVRFRWSGDASRTGSEGGLSNYGLDLSDPLDDKRYDPDGRGGWIGWGNWTQLREPLVFSHEDEGQTHYLYLKMRDLTHLEETQTDCVVAIYVARLSFARRFLVIDDLYAAPRPCVGSPPNDAATDASRHAAFDAALQDLIPAGDTPFEYSTFADETHGEPVELPPSFLEMLGSFQNTIWDCGSGQRTGLLDAIVDEHLYRYVEAGGNLLLLADQGPVSQTVGFSPTSSGPRCPGSSPLWARGSGFLWNFLHLYGCVDKPRDASGSTLPMAPLSLVRAEAVHPLYPDLVLSPQRWICGATPRGVIAYEGFVPLRGEHVPAPWFEEDAQGGGMRVLYRSRTRDAGTRMDSLPIAWRCPATMEQAPPGFSAGRVVVFAFHPYFFQEDNVRTAMSLALRWLATGRE